MKTFILISSLVYSLSLSLPPYSFDHMSLYGESEIENRLSTGFDGNTAVQMELMSFYVEPDKYRMTPSGGISESGLGQEDDGRGQLEVFGVKISPDTRQ